MTTRGHFKGVYSLSIFEARDVKKASPALYVMPILSGNKFKKTVVKRDLTPTWEYSSSLTAELSSVLSLRLKHFRGRYLPADLLGSVDIKIGELLDHCADGQRTTLVLRDKRGREAGSLIVQLRDTAPLEASVDPVDNKAILGVDQESPTSPAVPEPVQNVISSAAAVQDLGSDVVKSLKQVVQKTKAVVDLVDKTAKLHPYAHIAWQVLTSAYQAVQGQIEWGDTLRDLVGSMADLYSFVDDVDELEDKTKSLEHIIIRVFVQLTECGIFIKQFVSHRSAGRQTFSNTSQTISNLSQALKKLKEDLQLGVTSHTALVSAQISWDVKTLVEIEALKALNPATMDAGNRDTCLPGTRVDILENLINSLIDPSGHNIIWFRGPAGSGKSTILNSVAQYFSELHRCGAFLFWDRNDPVNSDPVRVIRTLAFQLGCFKPEICAKLSVQIENSSHTSPLDTQFKHLLEEPLAELAKESDLAPIVIILDALDECGAVGTRRNLLRTLSEGLARLPSMFRFLIASRDELDINAALSHPGVDVRDAPIGDESTSSDIRLLFQQRLASNAHAFVKHHLPSDWPTEPVIEQLVTLSGGLFIWASTTILFIESGSPKERLDKVLSGSGMARRILGCTSYIGSLLPIHLSHTTKVNLQTYIPSLV
ncbi:uncharacterized protein EI90DRAFT_839340 [Cantharellus anzutake]|uniref:uncharacterized protein n=1 Tax=Cantharellus anzutake TaxID=1750568 RepID=UPI001906F3AB|nr:uncharacterized protein EI90DRAFT_839340 [Cantharellus anzutake]KAF8343194.1 hypothetical protein EI90DRAFT_839340 [Cantharellus anzutake]